MLKNLIYTVFVFFLIANSVFAEKINKINITGNNRISSETIKLFGNFDIGSDVKSSDLNIILKNLYETNFFEDVKIKISDNILNISVVEHKIIQSVELKGIKSKKLKDPIFKEINLKKNSSFNEYLVKKDKEKILNILKRSGYYFANVGLNKIDNSNNTVSLIYNIELGDKAKIQKIKFVGDKKFKSRKLYSVIVSEENKFWKFISNRKLLDQNRINLDKRLLENFYKNKGYYNVKVQSSFAQLLDDGQFELIFNINSGNKYFFNDLKIILPEDYDRSNFSKIDNLLIKLKDKPYSYNNIEKILDNVELIALNEQYESINATVEESIVSNNKMDFTILISEVKKEYVERINIVGNNITREEVFRNNFSLDEGDAFNNILLAKSVNNLKSLNFFKSVTSNVQDGSTPNTKIITIEVEERPTGEITAGAGVGTSGSTIGFGVKENNFLGRGIQFGSNVELSEESIRGNLTVQNPNFRGSDQSINFNIQSSETDRLSNFGYKTTKTGIGLGTRFEYYDDFFIQPSISSYYESLKVSSTASSIIKKQKGSYFDTDINYTIDYDKRNQRFQTSDGFRSRFSQSLPIISETNALINGYEFNGYQEMFDGMIGQFTFYAKTINSLTDDDVRISERLYMPYSKLRGFESGRIGPVDNSDFVGGNYISAINLAATLPNFLPDVQNTDFSIFLDAGNVWGVDYSSVIDDSNKIRSSAGLALDWYTPVGPLSFSYAGILTKANTDKTESFRFNIGTTF